MGATKCGYPCVSNKGPTSHVASDASEMLYSSSNIIIYTKPFHFYTILHLQCVVWQPTHNVPCGPNIITSQKYSYKL